jgi:flagellar biosynthesis/type III secretory pathway ATPase
LQPGDVVAARPDDARFDAGPELLGRVLDGFGQPMDGGPPVRGEERRDLYATPPGPLEREPISEPLVTGVRAIDGLLPFGKDRASAFLEARDWGRARSWARWRAIIPPTSA